MMLKLFLRLILRYRREKLIYNLSRVEAAVGLFCYSQAERATQSLLPSIANELLHHGKEEIAHAEMLGSLLNDVHYPRPKNRWIQRHVEARDYSQWTPGLQIPQISSLSIGRILFCNRPPQARPLDEVLAFMSVLEIEAHKFYSALADVADTDLANAARKLARDEIGHAKSCQSECFRISSVSREYGEPVPDVLAKWRFRVAIVRTLFFPLAILFLIR